MSISVPSASPSPSPSPTRPTSSSSSAFLPTGLEPVAAASLVCNVVQLAGHAINAILLLRQIRAEHAPDQSVERHAQAVATLAAKVVRGLKRNDDGSRELSEDDERVLDVATECQQAARELGEMLADAPRVRRGGLRAWRVVAWVVRKRGRLESLEARMERAQALLVMPAVVGVVNALGADAAKLSAAHQTMVKRIQEGRHDIMDVVFQDGAHSRQVTFETDLTRAQLESVANARRLVVATRMESGHTLTSILVKRGEPAAAVAGVDEPSLKEEEQDPGVVVVSETRPSSQGDVTVTGAPATPAAVAAALLDPGHERDIILASLVFPEQDARRRQVGRHAVGAFDWLWEAEVKGENDKSPTPPEPERVAWGVFSEWLGQGGVAPPTATSPSASPVFWLTGKAGSGKSTLAQCVLAHPGTLTRLEAWSREVLGVASGSPFVAAHFFWRPGAELQKSYRGFLCSLLRQLLLETPHALAPVLGVLLQTNPSAPKNKRTPLDWAVDELERSCREALACLHRAARAVLVLVDGVDEVDQDNGDFDDLADFVDEVARLSAVKVVVAARPEPVMHDWLGACPRLRVQDLTAHEMETFARAHLTLPSSASSAGPAAAADSGHTAPNHHHHHHHHRNSWQQQRELDRLSRQLCERADGAFLWMRFAVGCVNRGVRNGDGLAEVEARVRRLPAGLHALYAYVWEEANRGSLHASSTNTPPPTSASDDRLRQRSALYLTAIVRAHDPAMYWLFNHARHTEPDVLDVVFCARPDLATSVLAADGPSRDLAALVADECDDLAADVAARCAGLVECRVFERDLWEWERSVRSATYYGVHNAKLALVHHSVYEFFQSVPGMEILAMSGLSDAEARVRLATAYLAACRVAFWITRTPFDALRFLAWLRELDARAAADPTALAEGERLLRVAEGLYAEGVLEANRGGRLSHFRRGRRQPAFLELALERGLERFVAATLGARLVSDDDRIEIFVAACRLGFQAPQPRVSAEFVRWMLRRDGGGVNPNALSGKSAELSPSSSAVPVDQLPPRSAFSAYLQHASCSKPLEKEWRMTPPSPSSLGPLSLAQWGGHSLWARRVLLNLGAFVKSGANLATHVPLLLSLDGGGSGGGAPLGFVRDGGDDDGATTPTWAIAHAPVVCYIVEAAVLVRDFLVPTAEAVLEAEHAVDATRTTTTLNEPVVLQQAIADIKAALRPFVDRRSCGYVYQFLDEHPRLMASFGRWSARPVSHDASVVLADALLGLFCAGGLALAKSVGELCWNVYLQSGPAARRVRRTDGAGRVVWESVAADEGVGGGVGGGRGAAVTWRWIVGGGGGEEEDAATAEKVRVRCEAAVEAMRAARERRSGGRNKADAVAKREVEVAPPAAAVVAKRVVESESDGSGSGSGSESASGSDSEEEADTHGRNNGVEIRAAAREASPKKQQQQQPPPPPSRMHSAAVAQAKELSRMEDEPSPKPTPRSRDADKDAKKGIADRERAATKAMHHHRHSEQPPRTPPPPAKAARTTAEESRARPPASLSSSLSGGRDSRSSGRESLSRTTSGGGRDSHASGRGDPPPVRHKSKTRVVETPPPLPPLLPPLPLAASSSSVRGGEATSSSSRSASRAASPHASLSLRRQSTATTTTSTSASASGSGSGSGSGSTPTMATAAKETAPAEGGPATTKTAAKTHSKSGSSSTKSRAPKSTPPPAQPPPQPQPEAKAGADARPKTRGARSYSQPPRQGGKERDKRSESQPPPPVPVPLQPLVPQATTTTPSRPPPTQVAKVPSQKTQTQAPPKPRAHGSTARTRGLIDASDVKGESDDDETSETVMQSEDDNEGEDEEEAPGARPARRGGSGVLISFDDDDDDSPPAAGAHTRHDLQRSEGQVREDDAGFGYPQVEDSLLGTRNPPVASATHKGDRAGFDPNEDLIDLLL